MRHGWGGMMMGQWSNVMGAGWVQRQGRMGTGTGLGKWAR